MKSPTSFAALTTLFLALGCGVSGTESSVVPVTDDPVTEDPLSKAPTGKYMLGEAELILKANGTLTLAGEEFSTTYIECAAGRGDAFTDTTCLIFKESTATPRGLAKVDNTWSLGNVDKADDRKLRLTEPPQVFRPAGKRRKQPKRRKGNR